MVLDTYHRFLRKITHMQVQHPVITMAFIAALTIMMIGGASQMRMNASLEQMMPPDVEEIRAFNELRDQGMGQDMIAVVLSIDKEATHPDAATDIRDHRVYEHISSLKQGLTRNSDVITAYAYTDFLPSGLDEESYGRAMDDPAMKERLQGYINPSSTRTVIILSTDIAADDDRMNALAEKVREDVRSAGSVAGVTAELTGTPVVQQRLGQLIQQDQRNTRWLSTLFVLLVTAIIFFSVSSAIVPILIVTISVTWLYGTMGYGGLPVSTLSAGVAAMVIGIGIDFSIHIINKFKFERKKGYSIKESIECAVVETGTGLTATSITTIAAFLAFMAGTMPEMNRFGLLMAIGIAYSLIFSLFGLPALLVLEEKIIYWVRDTFSFGIEKELRLKGGETDA